MNNNKRLRKFLSIILVGVLIIVMTPGITEIVFATGNGITVEKDTESTYVPTTIVNGKFDNAPWMQFTLNGVKYNDYKSSRNGLMGDSTDLYDYYKNGDSNFSYDQMYGNGKIVINGTGEGWNTSERTLLNGSLFEWVDGFGWNAECTSIDWNRNYCNGVDNTASKDWKYATNDDADKILLKGNYFVEMNANNPAVLYQDLKTYSGDIIRWTLDHAVREEYGFNKQTMVVEIGAPVTQNGNIVYPSGVGDQINTNIQANTSSKYYYTGTVINGTNAKGYSDLEKLKNLRLSRTEQHDKWYSSQGVYIIPENQSTTRFAFVSAYADPDEAYPEKISGGNLLDNITFNTLIGNLHAVQLDDGSVIVTGYWGETDPDKKLVVKIGNVESELKPDNGNFKITIDNDKVGDVSSVEIYHTDYEDAKKVVSIRRQYDITFDSRGGSSIEAQHILDGNKVTKPADPTKEGYTFAGWYANLISETPYNFDDGVSALQVLYAKWTSNTYTVTFDPNGGELDSQDLTKPVTFDSEYGELPIPTKEGYTFQGWYTDDSFTEKITEEDTLTTATNQTLIARWLIIPGEITKDDIDDNYLDTNISNDDEELISIIPVSDDDETKLKDGKDLTVFVEVEDASKTITKYNADLMSEKLNSTEKVGTYLDINIFKQFEGEEKQLIEKSDAPLKVSVKLPESLRGKDGYKIVVIEDGVSKVIDATLENDTLTFEIKASSVYALVYSEKINPTTSDDIYTYIGLLVLSSLGITYTVLYVKINKKRELFGGR